ncbi:class I SAM-dependent methyltransferase [Natronococcus sp. JC468]|uniref:class I SAM-dependent methyltransferase n=1 Tax=Natronococcus sp. JC468 TaxID=1961921 RepID=UPI00143ABB99|nr:class I SAM-dependent methyltransferase [Natronococcus sp. JC468]NKE35397.1 class I SAM-dependent methyltransferase [Natronococcus sp. JC468]
MLERDAVRRSYDELAETYAANRSEDGRATELLARFLESLPDSSRVLDAGCGQGTPVLERLGESTTAVGLDFSRAQLALAADSEADAALVQGEMTSLPFGRSTFDAAVAYWSLIHVPTGDQSAVLDEFARVLKPGGRALVCEGTDEWRGTNPNWLDSGVGMEWDLAGAAATAAGLRDAGFEIVDRWGVPEELDGAGGDGDEEDPEHPWTLFDARLESSPR